jgi:putative tricarboxylic transport membrane protein
VIPEILSTLLAVFSDPYALLLSLGGTLLGIVLGALPGISSTMSLAVLLPISFSMGPTHAMMFLMGVFSASVYGGSISAILINIPGTPGAIVTQMDGYPMARNGRAGEALTYALLSSAFGGVLGWLLLVSFAPAVARAALFFQSPEYAAVTFFGLVMLAYASPGSTFRAIVGGVFGLLLATVGLDAVTFISRFDFGSANLMGGLSIVPVAVGIFGLAEVLRNVERGGQKLEVIRRIDRLFPPWQEARRLWPMAIRGGIIGALVGAIPAAGSAIGVTVSYAQEKRMSKHPERFGTGIPEGIVAPESSNNACVGGALIPMMTLGIPGDSMTAVLVGALLIHGLRPGPQLFVERLDFVAAVYVALLLAIVFTTLFGLVGIRLFARILTAPKNVLMTGIAALCVVGSYAVGNSLFDVLVMIAFGALGYVMSLVKVPVAPVVFGLILGPILEENIRRSLIVNDTWWVFFTRPISALMILVSVAALVYPWLRARLEARKAASSPPPAS